MTRTEMQAETLRLHEQGYTNRRIATRLGVSNSTIGRWLNPDVAERNRVLSLEAKRRRTGTCIDCGGTTRYDGRGVAERCAPCRKAFERSDVYRELVTKWPPGRIIAAIREWAGIHGEPPAVPDWCPYFARQMRDEQRALRFERAGGAWPAFMTVVNHFGSWNAGIRAAGFEPRAKGGGNGNNQRRRAARERAAA